MTKAIIALVGDRSEAVTAHRAIPEALGLAREKAGVDVGWEWVATPSIINAERDLAGYSALWVVPGSPYESAAGAIGAIRWAREGKHPFLGTCGGFQHALLEYAQNAAGIPGASHAETDPDGPDLVVTPLTCGLVERTGTVHFAEGSILRAAYGRESSAEGYRCNYGLNPLYQSSLEAAGLRFTSWDDSGEIRGAELPTHPFFAGVLFQPERAALRGEVSPLVLAFVMAAAPAG